ncbi:BRCA1 C Terminus (BRCT) domain [Carpediemonas membranifera]|uniref:BRCA1 C Terminus (BRCT) domain n=1 Tax=Carpediemonas membranifera TaxID=201153 RepID=A0A8J6E6S6_9EUKA|nr:BRCA1 C Terminus (BRCT) domain [Carpediemonas membranifera]|eukprot:KAG9389860.1 BRCA1 C Terminus (BRCT) domain [Carpediemonas membranifera]
MSAKAGFLNGITVTVSGFYGSELTELKQQITNNGGLFSETLNHECSFLIARKANTRMVIGALSESNRIEIPIVTREWVQASQDAGCIKPTEPFTMPLLYNLRFSSCGVSINEYWSVYQALVKAGAIFCSDLTDRTDYLLVSDLENVDNTRSKVRAAQSNTPPIPLVDVDWVKRVIKAKKILPIAKKLSKPKTIAHTAPARDTETMAASSLAMRMMRKNDITTVGTACQAVKRRAAVIDFDGQSESFQIKMSGTPASRSRLEEKDVVVYISGVDDRFKTDFLVDLERLLQDLDGQISQLSLPPTHVVVPPTPIINTVKVLVGLATGAHIVTSDWVKEWVRSGGDMPEPETYLHPDVRRAVRYWQCSLARLASRSATPLYLFSGLRVALLSHNNPRESDIKTLLELGGAQVEIFDSIKSAGPEFTDILSMLDEQASRLSSAVPVLKWSALVPYLTKPWMVTGSGRMSNFESLRNGEEDGE